jgi:ABC-2 type transport system permease protein
MKVRRVWAIARKEFLHVVRDPRSLGMALAIPMLLLTLFGSALSLDVDRVPLVVWDQSQTERSRELISRFRGSREFAIVATVRDYRAIARAIDSGQALLALIVPVDFARRAASGRGANVQLIVDGSDSNTATLASGYADAVALMFAQDVAARQARRIGGAAPRPPLDVRPRIWFNPELESRNAIVPGLIAVIMMVIAALLTSLTVAREWERGTMEQLIATPIRRHELVLGKLLPYFAIGLFDVVVAVLLGVLIFRVPLRGSVALLFAGAAVFLVGALALGMVISIVARNQFLATQVAMLATLLPSFLLSGFLFSIRNMPRVVQWATYLVPARYLVALLKGIYLKGVGLDVLAPERVYEKVKSRRIKTLEHQMAHSEIDPRLARLLRTLVIFAQSPVSAQPGERPLHDPAPFQNFELLLLLLGLIRRPHDQLQDPVADPFGPLGDVAVVDPIGQDLLQPREPSHQLLQHQLGPVAILDARRVDHRRHDQAQRVDDQVPLPAVDLLERVLAPRPPLFRGLDALAVDDAHARALLPLVLVADLGAQSVVDLRPSTVVAPLAEVVVARTPGGQVFGHHPPGAAAAGDVEDTVEDLTQFDLARPPAGLGRRQQAPEPLPLGVGQIGGIAFGLCPGWFGFHAEL